MSDLQTVMKQIDGIENSMKSFQEKAEGELKAAGSLSIETKNALDSLGNQQKEVAERLLALEQNGVGNQGGAEAVKSIGGEFTNSDAYANFINGSAQKARFEVQNNTLTGGDATVAPDRKSGVVSGDSSILTMESLFTHIPTSSNAIEYTREASFVNNAAEAAEGTAKSETDITFALETMPVSTVAHWIKISKQLASDAPALAAYVNNRMIYGVNKRVDTQLAVGDGTAPNLSGVFDTGNFTAHGVADAGLPNVLKSFALIRTVIGSLKVNGYMPNAVLLNPADCAQMDIDLLTTQAGQSRVTVDSNGIMRVWGVPVVESVGVAADTFAVGDFAEAGTVHDREAVTVELSDSDGDNFTQNLVTVRAERRLALTIEKPSAIIGGDLTPV